MSGKNKEWIIVYHPLVVKHDIPALDPIIRKRVRKMIEVKLSQNPTIYGLPLHGLLSHVLKIRIGDWRVLYRIRGNRVEIGFIGHRKEIYQKAPKRLRS